MTEPLQSFNMHMHTHFSFNAEALSPTELVEKALEEKLYAAAIVDFDTLDGLDEFYCAADRDGLRACVGMETRVFFSEYGDKVINSPGEPGVFYFMGMGFGRIPSRDSAAAKTIAGLREQSDQRNRTLIARINEAHEEIAIDYEKDVLPLTPAGNATERHIVLAYINKVRAECDEDHERRIWTVALGLTHEDQLDALMVDDVALQNKFRSVMMKRGGAGYVQPDEKTFPPLEDVITMIRQCGAIPMAAWLDGSNEGEADPVAQLECLKAKGVAAVNIVPERNWNFADADKKAEKVAALNAYVAAADALDMPVNVGTELNSFGLPFVDNFESDALKPHWPLFMKGAQIMVGQARLLRWAGMDYCGEAAADEFPDLKGRNEFFAMVGALPCPPESMIEGFAGADVRTAYTAIRDAVRKGEWTE